MSRKKISAIGIAVVLFMSIFLSYGYIAYHMHHHCTHMDCPTCIQIKETERYIDGIRVLLVETCVPAIAIACVWKKRSLSELHLCKVTLVSLKVELWN